MNYDDIFLFVQLIDRGSFIKLSLHLNIGQSTISRRIRSLEESLGKPLLRRNTRGLFEMTTEGIEFYNKFKFLSDDIYQYLSDFKQVQQFAGTLRISIPRAFFSVLIVPMLSQFHDLYPQVQLIFSYDGGEVDLIKNNLDLAIAVSPPNTQNCKQRLLMKSSHYLYASPEYIKQYGAPADLSTLTNHRLVGSSFNHQVNNNLTVMNNLTGEVTHIVYSPKLITNNAMFNLDLALNNGYIISAPEDLVKNEVDLGKLVKLLPEHSFGETRFYLLRHTGLRNHLEDIFINFFLLKDKTKKLTQNI
ncbi:MAG: LysR family transcriptional regulator [Burkholderiales bacterium]|nr:LysR family transcriptional regulator [Burkholderiales bacterium]